MSLFYSGYLVFTNMLLRVTSLNILFTLNHKNDSVEQLLGGSDEVFGVVDVAQQDGLAVLA
jgi:hypothetical protein